MGRVGVGWGSRKTRAKGRNGEKWRKGKVGREVNEQQQCARSNRENGTMV